MATATSADNTSTMSAAERLMEKERQAAAEPHNPTVEEVVDEEDIAHPPPSASAQDSQVATGTSTPAEPLSEKAAGKRPAREIPVAPSKQEPPFNPASEDLFPALGAPKSRAPASVAPAWGKKPTSNGANGTNGVNGTSNVSSRASTPGSGMLTPTSTAPSQAAPRGPVSLPGQHIERLAFAPHHLLPRNQLKKPMQDILRDINKRSKAKIEIKPGGGGGIVFEGRGPSVDAVRQALKDVAEQVGSKQSIKVDIPASVRSHIIGRQGATIQGISKRTGARIQIPKTEDSQFPDEDDDSATVPVLIEGNAVTAELARKAIEDIVNERTSTVNMRLRDIPAEYYPFLAGAHNARVNQMQQGRDVRVQIPQYHTWSTQAPPQSAGRNQPVSFQPQPAQSIQISGDRLAAQQARAEIERQVEQLRRQLRLEQLAVERGRHQFIVGDRGSSLHDFLEETGCAVILPPDSEDSEMLTIVGPPDKIENGINKVIDLAASMSMASVDAARQHANAPNGAQNHARNLARYLQQRRAVEQLEQMHNARFVLPTAADGPSAWEIYSREGKNTMRARSDIMNLIGAHPPSRLSPVDIDPFYHQHLQQQARQVRTNHGVHLVFPEEHEESPQVLFVYEGPGSPSEYELPRRQPSAQEVREFQTALQEAQRQILASINSQENIVSRNVEAPNKFHDKIRRYADREQANMPEGQFPVQLQLPGTRSARNRSIPVDGALLRGPTSAVDDFAERLRLFIEQEQRDEAERGYTTSFDFPQKFANHLIGRKGENIRKMREEFDVDIQVNDGKVELKGPKAKADACKAHILSMGKKLEDEATHTLKINPQYHRDLIGAKGSQVNRLQDRYNVRINFPRSAAPAADDQSVAETDRRFHQAPDEVVVKGPKKGADEAREELLNLLQWVVDNSNTATVSVAHDQLPQLIGQGGREMEALRLSTGAQIDVPGARDAVDPSGRAEIKIKGTKKQVAEAKKLLEERARVFDDTVSRTVDVDKKYHKTLIGAGGANIRNIVVEAGGSDDRRELARMVRFPRPESDDNTIRVEGSKAVVDKIVAAIEAFATQRENQVTENVEVAPEKHRVLIGRGGETRRNLENQFNVMVDIPKQGATGPQKSQVRISGQPSDVEKCKEHILSMVKEQEGETVQVPRRLHHVIADNGQFFRRLRNDHKVTVDHGGHHPPARPAALNPRGRANGANLPLITDDADAQNENFSWETHDLHSTSEQGDIPWILRGSPENVARAQQALQKALEQAQQQNTAGFLILPDPRAYRYVVGPGGSQINQIRKQTNTKVTVPRDQAKGEAIEIVGTKDGCEQAKDIILELVKNGGNGNGSPRRG